MREKALAAALAGVPLDVAIFVIGVLLLLIAPQRLTAAEAGTATTIRAVQTSPRGRRVAKLSALT